MEPASRVDRPAAPFAPLSQVPTLHVDGVQVTQSDAITRYAGKPGQMDHVPTDLVERLAPALNAHLHRIDQSSAVAQYYARFEA